MDAYRKSISFGSSSRRLDYCWDSNTVTLTHWAMLGFVVAIIMVFSF